MKINVNMDGEEYLRYLEKRKIKIKTGHIIIIISVCGLLLIPFIHEYFNPPEPVIYGYTTFKGYIIPNILIGTVILSICLAWVIHGFGFIIVKR